jgi:hypothetical protein
MAAPTFKVPDFPTIPFPEENLGSLKGTCLALKQAVETLMGTRGDRPVTRVFVQDTTPTALAKGDFWVKQQPAAVLSYWNGDAWIILANAP